MRTGQFDRGKQVGIWRTFDRSGRLVKETDFDKRPRVAVDGASAVLNSLQRENTASRAAVAPVLLPSRVAAAGPAAGRAGAFQISRAISMTVRIGRSRRGRKRSRRQTQALLEHGPSMGPARSLPPRSTRREPLQGACRIGAGTAREAA